MDGLEGVLHPQNLLEVGKKLTKKLQENSENEPPLTDLNALYGVTEAQDEIPTARKLI